MKREPWLRRRKACTRKLSRECLQENNSQNGIETFILFFLLNSICLERKIILNKNSEKSPLKKSRMSMKCLINFNEFLNFYFQN